MFKHKLSIPSVLFNSSSSSIVVREKNGTFKRRIREAFEIHCQASTLNHNVGYELLAIYKELQLSSLELINACTKISEVPSLKYFLNAQSVNNNIT